MFNFQKEVVINSADQYAIVAAPTAGKPSAAGTKFPKKLRVHGGGEYFGNYIIDNSNLKVLYISSEQFIYDFENSKKEDNSIFSNKFNDIDVLLFDDINYLSSNYEIQKEFFHIFNSLYANSKQIVLASNIAPKDLESFEERLKVRFFWGLIIKINSLNRNQL